VKKENPSVKVLETKITSFGRTHPKIPRVDLQCILHVFADSHELAQNAWALLRLLLGNDKFHRGGVHAISEWSDNSEIRNREKSIEFILLESLVTVERNSVNSILLIRDKKEDSLMVTRNEIQASIFPVNVGYQLANLSLQLG